MKAKIAVLKDERVMVWALVWVVLMLCVLYVYFMNQTVFNVAKRANLGQEIATLRSSISELEFTYISLGNNINTELAYSLGYKEVRNPIYISKTSVTALAVGNSVQ